MTLCHFNQILITEFNSLIFIYLFIVKNLLFYVNYFPVLQFMFFLSSFLPSFFICYFLKNSNLVLFLSILSTRFFFCCCYHEAHIHLVFMNIYFSLITTQIQMYTKLI